MKTFTSDDGQKWEEVENDYYSMDGRRVIRPIQVPKWKVLGPTKYLSDYKTGIEIYVYGKNTEPQAQLIKDWISAGMAYVIGETGKHQSYVVAMDKARNAIQKDSE